MTNTWEKRQRWKLRVGGGQSEMTWSANLAEPSTMKLPVGYPLELPSALHFYLPTSPLSCWRGTWLACRPCFLLPRHCAPERVHAKWATMASPSYLPLLATASVEHLTRGAKQTIKTTAAGARWAVSQERDGSCLSGGWRQHLEIAQNAVGPTVKWTVLPPPASPKTSLQNTRISLSHQNT